MNTLMAVEGELSEIERFIVRRIRVLLENHWTVEQAAQALGLSVEQAEWFLQATGASDESAA